MKIFIDVDNTILEHTSFYDSNTESRIHSTMGDNPKANEEGIKLMYQGSIISDPNNFKRLFNKKNVYILTKSSNEIYEKYKQERIARIFDFSTEELLNKKDSDGFSKYICIDGKVDKSKYIKKMFNIDNLKEFILIDDFSDNLISWEECEGIGIKFFNEYNSAIHPNGGLIISNFKVFNFLSDNQIDKYIFTDNYIYSNMKANNLNYISILDLLIVEITDAFDLDIIQFNVDKKRLINFLKEMYYFFENYKFTTLVNYIEQEKYNHKINIIDIPFAYNLNKYKDKMKVCNILCIEYNNKKNPNSNADVYITLPKGSIYEFEKETIAKSMQIIEKIIK